MNIPWIFKRYEDYPDSFSSSLFSTSINKLITNLYHNIYIRIFGKRIIDPSRFQYPFQIFSRVPLLKKFIFQHVYSPFTRSMNPSARSIKRYSSKITIHRLENSVIRLSNYQSFLPRLCENISLKIPENNRRSREWASSCRSFSLKDARIRKAWEQGGGKRASFQVVSKEVTRGRTRMLVDKLNTRGVTI